MLRLYVSNLESHNYKPISGGRQKAEDPLRISSYNAIDLYPFRGMSRQNELRQMDV